MKFKIGQKAGLWRQVDQASIAVMAELTGDKNPIHLSEEYARASRFGRPVAHGLYVLGMFSAVMGSALPGPGAVLIGQSVEYRAPVFVGDRIYAVVTVLEVKPGKNIVKVRTAAYREDRTLLAEGEARLLVE